MYVKALALCDFRNYEQLTFIPSEGQNILCGENAQGKTNLLEAIHLCAFGRSQRTAHDDEMIRHGAQSAVVKVRVCSESAGEHTISIFLGEQKQIEIDGDRIKRLADLMGSLKVVMFSPESLSLVKGAPQERRRFMDMCISQLSKQYFFRLQQYTSALRQRNALLKDPGIIRQYDYVRMWDEQLCMAGAYIMAARDRFLQRLTKSVSAIHEKLSNGADELVIGYVPSIKNLGSSIDEIREQFAKKLSESFEDDVRRGSTGVGIHKDDIFMQINGQDARSFSSQGQQRSAALSLRLSEIEFIHEVSDEYPVVLLDDVFSELDEGRCKALLSCMGECQCIFTSAQLPDFGDGQMSVFRCENGHITQ